MSNKPKNFKSHPNNNISNVEKAHHFLVKRARLYARLYSYTKHVGSKSVNKLKIMLDID